MLQGFSIITEHVDGEVRIMARGEFDRGAASRLLELLRDHEPGQEQVIIDTTGLGKIHAAACSVFKEEVQRFRMIEPRLRFIGCKGRVMTRDHKLVISGEPGKRDFR